jgi:hypothetical protein
MVPVASFHHRPTAEEFTGTVIKRENDSQQDRHRLAVPSHTQMGMSAPLAWRDAIQLRQINPLWPSLPPDVASPLATHNNGGSGAEQAGIWVAERGGIALAATCPAR